MEYYSAIKQNGIMPFAATWMDLGIIILSGVREREISYDIIGPWNLKYNTNELIYKIETDSQTQRTDLWLLRVRGIGEGWIGNLGSADANYSI